MPTHNRHVSRVLIAICALSMLVGCNTTPKAPEPQPRAVTFFRLLARAYSLRALAPCEVT